MIKFYNHKGWTIAYNFWLQKLGIYRCFLSHKCWTKDNVFSWLRAPKVQLQQDVC